MASQPDSEDLNLVHHEEAPATEQIREHPTLPDSPTVGPADIAALQLDSSTNVTESSTDPRPAVPHDDDNGPTENGRVATSITTAPVYYHTKSGPRLTEESVVISANGQSVVVTPDENSNQRRKPLTQKDIRFLKIFSILAIALFFPTGIVAMVFAFKVEKKYHNGIDRGDMEPARKMCKYCERLILLSLVLGLLSYVFVFAIVENNYRHHHDQYQHAYGT